MSSFTTKLQAVLDQVKQAKIDRDRALKDYNAAEVRLVAANMKLSQLIAQPTDQDNNNV